MEKETVTEKEIGTDGTSNRESESASIPTQQTEGTELATYRAEIQRLSAILADREKAERESQMFKRLYPKVDLTQIPDQLQKESKETGIPLIYLYSVYAREEELSQSIIEQKGSEASRRSSGYVSGRETDESSFTLDEIRNMNSHQVKKNYKAILKSLAKYR
jgi:hypothetical protein